MACPATAPPGHSIWDVVPRASFEAEIDALDRRGIVPEPHVLLENDWPDDREGDALPFGVALQASDDFAFISACEYGVGLVSVAAIEPRRISVQETILRLAANEGVPQRVQNSVSKLLRTLEKCATKEISREQCEEDLFETIQALNMNRILGRLDSKHFQKPHYYRGASREPLTDRLRTLLSCTNAQTALQKQKLDALSNDVDSMHNHFIELEKTNPPGWPCVLKTIIRAAYHITVDGISLPERLADIGLSAHDTREIREVGKIANYWRICCYLTHLTRSYRDIFTTLRLEVVVPYRPLSGLNRNRFVHAEIQMIVHYETSSVAVWPLALGASKEACYLCYSFITAHGRFSVSKAHRQLFPQWTVPDLADYTPETLQRLRIALERVTQAVRAELRSTQYHQRLRLFPLQSSINLHRLNLPTPSSTSLAPSCGLSHNASSSIDSANSVVRLQRTTQTALPRKTEKFQSAIEHHPPDASHLAAFEITPDSSSGHADCGWIDLSVQLDPPGIRGEELPCFHRASVRVYPLGQSWVTNGHSVRSSIFVEDLVPGREITFEVSHAGHGGEHCGQFILRDKKGSALQVRCTWHI